MAEYALVPLFDRQDLARKCINLLNEEWPRSDGSREHSQKKSCRSEPPMSFLLIRNIDDELVGHARVCNLPNKREGCWIESVIVSGKERSKGLGKLLMLETEKFVKRFGYNQAFLCTEDKEEFYRRCGYVECDPVIHSTAATSVFPIFEKLESNVGTEVKTTSTSERAETLCSSAPPAPPPPPPRKQSMGTMTTIDHQYMKKNI
ncbi:unnamed protein product [Auanema sp. JU1783]|nr:unnamed protein product [Auanema sp. JU1783]